MADQSKNSPHRSKRYTAATRVIVIVIAVCMVLGLVISLIANASELSFEQSEIKEDVDIICNRPFLFFIKDTVNDDIAFIGLVNTIAEDLVR